MRNLRMHEYGGEWRIAHYRRAGAPQVVIASFLYEADARACFEVMKSLDFDPTRVIVNSQKEAQT